MAAEKKTAKKAAEAVKEEIKVVEKAAATEVKAVEKAAEKEVKKAAKKVAATETKKTVKKAAETVVKEAEKATRKVAATAKKVTEPEKNVYIEFAGKQFQAKAIVEQAMDIYKDTHKGASIKSVEVYVNADEGAAYYVVNGEASPEFRIDL